MRDAVEIAITEELSANIDSLDGELEMPARSFLRIDVSQVGRELPPALQPTQPRARRLGSEGGTTVAPRSWYQWLFRRV